jgi:hypothetical protein
MNRLNQTEPAIILAFVVFDGFQRSFFINLKALNGTSWFNLKSELHSSRITGTMTDVGLLTLP